MFVHVCRLGVRSAALHDLYSAEVSQALKSALQQFERRMPGFISDAGLLHGVETRTSSPVSNYNTLLSNDAFVPTRISLHAYAVFKTVAAFLSLPTWQRVSS